VKGTAMRVIFLDIDGVLNGIDTTDSIPGTPYRGIDHSKVRLLKKLVDLSNMAEHTVIVLTSTWRMGQDYYGNVIPGQKAYLSECLAKQGLSVYGETPVINRGRKRGTEIKEWLLGHDEVTGIVILDDHLYDFWAAGLLPYWLQTDEEEGLKEELIGKALKILELKWSPVLLPNAE